MTPLARLGGRKFSLTLLITALLSLLLVGGYLTPLIYRDLLFTLFGGYFASNVSQKFLTKESTK